jgi:ATP-dependent RNA helicase DDX3X
MPIQSYIIPAVLTGHDVVGISQTGMNDVLILVYRVTDEATGSGKTAAYLVPAISKLAGKVELMACSRRKGRAEPLIVIMVPTRELALQIFNDARRLCYRTMMRPCVAYGGRDDTANSIKEISKGCDILIGTPGKLKDLMEKPDVLTMSRVK